MCRIVVSFARVYRVGVWFGFVRVALLLAIILCWVDRCFCFLGVAGLILASPCNVNTSYIGNITLAYRE